MKTPNFDRVARLYRTAEYLTLGRLLERCRFHHLPALGKIHHALVLGDGDGRFTARLLASAPNARVHAVDLSPAMLRLLCARAAGLGIDGRLTITCADARIFVPTGLESAAPYDLVVTHFFLDCLTPAEVGALVARLQPHLAPDALWLVSEFEVPAGGGLRAAVARGLIAGLYCGFHLLTGLGVRQIPAWREDLAQAGFAREASRGWLGGILISELWQTSGLGHVSQTTAPAPPESHRGWTSTPNL